MFANVKHASLLQQRLNNIEKKFYNGGLSIGVSFQINDGHTTVSIKLFLIPSSSISTKNFFSFNDNWE
jgi:hypothetical protein